MAGRGGKKPKLPANLRKEARNLTQLGHELRRTLFLIHQKKRRLSISERELGQLEKQTKPSICFGSRRLFRKQFQIDEKNQAARDSWGWDWQFARSSQCYWLGSHDESFRNQNAQCNPLTKTLSLRLPQDLAKAYGERLEISNLVFPEGQAKLEEALTRQVEVYSKKKKRYQVQGIPVSYRILARLDHSGKIAFYCQATFEELAPQVKSDARIGAIGIDLNADHLAVAEIDHYGNPVGKVSYPIAMEGKSSEQIKAILGDHIAEIVDLAKAKGKILVCETLDFEKKKQALRETSDSKRYRRMLSSFAYKKFHDLLSSRAKKEGVELKSENPAFTSVIGWFKFRGFQRYSSHELAAVAIARRGLRLRERIRTKHALHETVSIQGLGEVHSERHVWSYFRANGEVIRTAMRNSPQGNVRKVPRRRSGYHEVTRTVRCDVGTHPARPP